VSESAAKARRAVPRARWLAAFVLLSFFASIFLVNAYVNADFTPDSKPSTGEGTAEDVPDAISLGGPIIDDTKDEPHAYGLPPMTIALTFDDGPNPVWTPKIMSVLRKYQVNGTFFVVGSQVARYPDIVRKLADGGNEIAIHTFTHPHMTDLPAWRQNLEYSQTQMAIIGATGRKAALLRLPYSSENDAIDDQEWAVMERAGELGYLTVMTTTDSEDWAIPGVRNIIKNATPAAGKSAIVLMHDAGGDRAQTVAALEEYVPRMLNAGYRFTTVSTALAQTLAEQANTAAPPIAGNPPASKAERQRGYALVAAVQISDALFLVIGLLFMVVGALMVLRTLLLFLLARRHARRRRSRTWSWGAPVTDPVSVIVPAYNEKEGIEAAVRSLAGGDHPGGIEVVVVDDGSTDGTAAIVDALRLPNVRVVRIPNGGKPNALNVGVALARHDLIVMVDGDTVFEPDALRHLVQPFADPKVGAVAGNVKVGNRKSMVAKWQHIEYVIGFNLDRRLYDLMQCMPTVPGAIGAWRRSALAQIGGMTDDTLAEDTDVTMAMCRAGWKVVYEERARAWTEAPATLRQLWLQRYRWSYGTMQAIWKHKRALIDRGPSGRFGRVGLPHVAVFGVALPLLAPLIDILAVYGLFFFDRTETALAWLGMLGLQLLTAVVAFRLDKEKLRALWVLPLQQFAYRQLMYLVLIQSVLTALMGARLRWHKLHRTGLGGNNAPVDLPAQPAAVVPRPIPAIVTAEPMEATTLRPRGVARVQPPTGRESVDVD
jgi:cellulose synthase/poly-beta-1,6-N-acetylglucosamine synthase-like glycosyltransferase/peptidoglycan/xylan/chitin deacetylase (PgdA/CDA1 family)